MERLHTGLSDTVELLTQSEFFKRLLQDDLYWLASRSGLYLLGDNELLFSAGDRAERFFVLRRGGIAVSRTAENGEQREMARFEAGDVVGDFDFARSADFDAQARSIGPTELVAFPDFGRGMSQLAQERPDVAARILLRSVAMISSRVRSTQHLISDNAPWVRELRKQMYTDSPTGLWSRAFLDEELPKLLVKPSALVLLKPDHFKELCDRWGHGVGDIAMERIAELLKAEARTMRRAWAIRLRSNETALAIAGKSAAEAVRIAARLSRGIAGIKLEDALGGESFRLSASVSIALWPEDGEDFKKLVEHAYGVLMRAWRDGGARAYRARPQCQDAQA
jgi:diguanylate cyclase (GGDEF)-like protein